MRKYLNWFLLSSVVILVTTGILLFIFRNEDSEGAIFGRILIIAYSTGYLIVLYGIKRIFEANGGKNMNKLEKAVGILTYFGALIAFMVSGSLGILCVVPLLTLIVVAKYRQSGKSRE